MGVGEDNWCHINDATEAAVRELLPAADVVNDGDCGSVWGEHHECPHPHVLIRNPTQESLEKLRLQPIGYVVTGPDWENVLEEFAWVEDERCPQREPEETGDYRKPYVRSVP